MYLNFYQFYKKPFSLAPDPDFLYLSQSHKDAMGAIIYGVREREGFVSVVGEVGTGKTTVVRSYLHKAGRDRILPVFIFNAKITFTELIKTFLTEIGIEHNSSQNINDMVQLAYRIMLEKAKQGINIVLIIDEAQNMPVETLGNLCILSNLETSKNKLIQIVLVGQPELHKKLALYKLRQLRQRIAYRAVITPLSESESIEYLNHRLSLVARKQNKIFTARAIRRIVKHSKGIPRVINILCENALVASYGMQKKPVTLRTVNQVISEYNGSDFSYQTRTKNVAFGALVCLATGLFAATLYSEKISAMLPWNKTSTLSPQLAEPEDSLASKKHLSEQRVEHAKPLTVDQPVVPNENPVHTNDPVEVTSFQAEEGPLQPVESNVTTVSPAAIKNVSVSTAAKPLIKEPVSHKNSPRLRTVKKGDTVSDLFYKTYGFVNTRALEWFHNQNQHIPDLDVIQVDDKIYFPEKTATRPLKRALQAATRSITAREEVVSR